jgi:hypothetical protein
MQEAIGHFSCGRRIRLEALLDEVDEDAVLLPVADRVERKTAACSSASKSVKRTWSRSDSAEPPRRTRTPSAAIR